MGSRKEGDENIVLTGLTEREAAERLRREGANEIPSAKRRGLPQFLLEVAREPMFLLLVSAGAIYLALGDRGEALILLASVFIIMGITFYQERRTERALQALRDLSSPLALVIREGEQRRIASQEVVRGDLLVLREGDRASADGVVLSCDNLSADESLLTGESVPTSKAPWDGVMEWRRPGGPDLPFVYSGSLIVEGQGIARTWATGPQTEIGKIGKELQETEAAESPLRDETRRWVRRVALAGAFLCVWVVVLYAMTRGGWLDGFLAGVTLAMSILPEEIPVVLTVFLALGAWRIAQKEVLTRRAPAIETLGEATVLCVDKTGTLTLNQMAVSQIFIQGKFYELQPEAPELPSILHEIVAFSLLASESDPFDPMEKAFARLDARLPSSGSDRAGWTLARRYPLSPGLPAKSHVWKPPDSEEYVVAAKGAPEAIARLCRFDPTQTEALLQNASAMAREGLRVLGVAKARFAGGAWPSDPLGFEFHFLGFVGLSDPPRPTVPEAVRELRAAGIRVVMVTGDYPVTAQAIARRVGLSSWEEVMTGAELERIDDSELRRRIQKIDLFARVLPEQKLRLVNAFKANGEVVAMTGDGVNDAPALKAAHIGVAMGKRGTDVAREAASLILLNDEFASIAQAVRLGRRIFDNLRKAMTYILAIHVPIGGLSLIPLLAGWPLFLFPAHVVFLELIIDPACSIAFEAEPEEADVMRRPPRKGGESLIGRRTFFLSALQGLGLLLATSLLYGVSLHGGQSPPRARAMAFTALISGNLSLIFANRSRSRTILETLWTPNQAAWGVVGIALVLLASVLYLPSLRVLFRFEALSPRDLAVSFATGAAGVLWFEGFKLIEAWRKRRPGGR